MKKNAFTLIELIATVVVLCIVFLFVTPKLVELINKNENKNKEIIEEKLLDAGREYVSTYNRSFKTNFTDVNDTAYITIQELVEIGLFDSSDVSIVGNNARIKVVLGEYETLHYSIDYTS